MINELRNKTNQLVEDMFEMCVNAGDGHVTSCLSCAEIMTTLYYGGFIKHDPNNPQWEERDRFMLSKAQASPIFYSLLADRGYFNKEEMDKFAQQDGIFGVHLQSDVSKNRNFSRFIRTRIWISSRCRTKC